MIRPNERGNRGGRSGKRPARTKAKTAKAPSGGSAKGGCRSKAIAVTATGFALLAFLLFRPT